MYRQHPHYHQPIHQRSPAMQRRLGINPDGGSASKPSSARSTRSNVVEGRVIKSGASGTAVLCEDTDTGRKVVKKRIKCKTQREVENAKNEAQLLEDLRSTNVIGFGSFEQPNRREVDIIMDYADGGDLGDEIDKRARRRDYYTEQQLLERFADMVKAISTMHARGIVHRDIKPQNIFLQDGKAKVGDFGIARTCSTNGRVRTPVGTPLYLDPQRCEGRDYGQKADMWSLGCVLYEMACLEPAFTAKSMGELKRKVLRGNVDYSRIPSHYSDEIKHIIKGLLEVKEQNRLSVTDLLRNSLISRSIHQRDLLKLSQSSSESSADERALMVDSDEDNTINDNSKNRNNHHSNIRHNNNISNSTSSSSNDAATVDRGAQYKALRKQSMTPPLRKKSMTPPSRKKSMTPPPKENKWISSKYDHQSPHSELNPIQRIKTPESVRQEVRNRPRLGSYNRARSHSPAPHARRDLAAAQRRSPLANSGSARTREHPNVHNPHLSSRGRSVSPNPKPLTPLGSRRSEYKDMKSNLQFEPHHANLHPEHALNIGASTSRALHAALGHISDGNRKDFVIPSIGRAR